MGKVLFISHHAGRTGAPLMLLGMLRWLKEKTDLPFEILLRSSGPLEGDFSAVAPTFIYQNRQDSNIFVNLIARKLGAGDFPAKKHHLKLLRQFKKSGIDLIYSNTFTNGDILQTLAPLGCPVITHVHEMEGWIQQSGEENLRRVLNLTSHFITASRACKKNLVESHSLSPEKIDVVHSFIPLPSPVLLSNKIREEVGIPEDAFVVLGSGHEGWRKGKDLFAPLAAMVKKRLGEKPVHFLWVGGWQSHEEQTKINYDLMNLGVDEVVHFVGEVNNPLDYFAAGDVFALVSREDTFPLVCLEAAAFSKPVLCFADAGGMPEFVEKDAGFIVPYLDLEAMAEKIVHLARNGPVRSRLGKNAAEKVVNFHDVSSGTRLIESIIRRLGQMQNCSAPATRNGASL